VLIVVYVLHCIKYSSILQATYLFQTVLLFTIQWVTVKEVVPNDFVDQEVALRLW